MNKVIVCWKDQQTGKTGHGDAVDPALAEEYINRNAASFPSFEFTLRPEQAEPVETLAGSGAAR